MRKILCILMYGATTAYAQTNNTFPTNGNVGIGTLAPNANLTITANNTGMTLHSAGSPYFGAIAFNRDVATGHIFDNAGKAFQINNGGNTQNLHFQVYNGNGQQIAVNALVLSGQNGHVGIGVENPSEALEVNGVIQAYNKDNPTANWDNIRIWADGGNGVIESNGDEHGMIIRSNGGDKILLMNNVGIGTTTPTEKLSVNGKIRAREIKVEANNWPDYVFEDDYQLPSLAGIEKFIKINKHLPEVPSAKEVEQNGIALGEMNKILLKKIEELTLHLIEKDKTMQELLKRVAQLEKNK